MGRGQDIVLTSLSLHRLFACQKLFKSLLLLLMMNLILYEAKAQGLACEPCSVDGVDFPGTPTPCTTYVNDQINLTIGTSVSSVNYTSVIFPGQNIVSLQNFVVHGTLYIDSDITFQFCHFRMGEESVIITSGAFGFQDLASVYDACEKMWKGIRVTNFADIENTFISDAQYGLRVQTSATVSSQSATFDRCYVGIINSGTGILTLLPFTNNVFSCSSPLNSPYTGQSPSPGNITRAGIELNTCTSTIGNSSTVNYFNNLIYGIKTQSTNLTIEKCSFTDMEQVVGVPESGTAIHVSHGANVLINGQGETIQDAEYAGVYANESSIEVLFYQFTGKENFGVLSEANASGQFITIAHNVFNITENGTSGIRVVRSKTTDDTDHVNINYNYMTVYSDIFSGIEVLPLFKTLDKCHIEDNIMFFLDEHATGIYVHGGNTGGFQIDRNFLYYPSSLGTSNTGIYIVDIGNKGGHSISDNSVVGDANFELLNGIYVSNTPDIKMCNNYVDQERCGIVFRGNCNPVYFQENQFNHHFHGLLLENSALPFNDGIIGIQTRRLNTWLYPIDYVNEAAKCTATTPLASEFKIQTSSLPYFPVPISSPSTWFTTQTGDPDVCPPDPNLLLITPPASETDMLIAEGIHPGFENSEIAKWELQNGLYRRLSEHPAQMEGNDMLTSFYEQLGNENIGRFAYYESLVQDAFDHPLEFQVEALYHAVKEAMSEVMEMENTLPVPEENDTEYQVDPEYLEARKILLEQVAGWREEMESLLIEMTAARMEKLEEAAAYLNDIEPAAEFEQKRKVLYGIYLQVYKGLTLTDEQVAGIYDIASSSTSDNGNLVNEAIALLPPCEQENFLQYIVPEDRDILQKNSSSGDNLLVFPNPAKEVLNIHTARPGTISLTNSQGMILQNQLIAAESNSITWNIKGLPQGVYFISLQHENGAISVKKVWIIKD
jgi:hypothetical protein